MANKSVKNIYQESQYCRGNYIQLLHKTKRNCLTSPINELPPPAPPFHRGRADYQAVSPPVEGGVRGGSRFQMH